SPWLPRPHLQPFCPQPPRRPSHGICSRSRFCSARGRWPEDPALGPEQREQLPRRSWRGLRTALAGSPVGVAESGLRCVMFDMSRYYGRVVHLRQLSTSCRHDAVAFGYRRVNVPPDGDLHPAVCTPSQAHERGLYAASPESTLVSPVSNQPLLGNYSILSFSVSVPMRAFLHGVEASQGRDIE